MTSFQDQIQQAMAEFAQQRARLSQARSDLEQLTVSASSKDHLVTVTLGASGEVKEIKFHRTDYAAMAPAELSAVLVETLARAREKAAAGVQEAFGSLAGFGAGLRDSLAGGDELTKIFDNLQTDAVPAAVRVRTGEEADRDG